MIAIQKPFNLLFSLPDVLMTEVFEFDTTCRIFHTTKFRKELVGSSWLNAHRTTCAEHVREHILTIMNGDTNIVNEYGYFSDFEDGYFGDETDLIEYTQDNFEIYLHPSKNGHNHMYYKILPKGSTKENCAFLRNPEKFDGFLCHKNRANTYTGIWQDGYQQVRRELIHTNFFLFPRLACEWVDGICLFNF